MIKMIICNGNKIHDLDYDIIGHWIHLNAQIEGKKRKAPIDSSSLAKVPIRFPPLPLGRFRQVFKLSGQYTTDIVRILYAGIGVTGDVLIA